MANCTEVCTQVQEDEDVESTDEEVIKFFEEHSFCAVEWKGWKLVESGWKLDLRGLIGY